MTLRDRLATFIADRKFKRDYGKDIIPTVEQFNKSVDVLVQSQPQNKQLFGVIFPTLLHFEKLGLRTKDRSPVDISLRMTCCYLASRFFESYTGSAPSFSLAEVARIIHALWSTNPCCRESILCEDISAIIVDVGRAFRSDFPVDEVPKAIMRHVDSPHGELLFSSGGFVAEQCTRAAADCPPQFVICQQAEHETSRIDGNEDRDGDALEEEPSEFYYDPPSDVCVVCLSGKQLTPYVGPTGRVMLCAKHYALADGALRSELNSTLVLIRECDEAYGEDEERFAQLVQQIVKAPGFDDYWWGRT